MSTVAAQALQQASTEAAQGVLPGTVALALARARRAFKALEEWLLSEDSCQRPWHAVEREQERRAREIHRLLLEARVAQRGTGDVGPAVEVQSASAPDRRAPYTHRRLDPRHPQTIFSEITVQRTGTAIAIDAICAITSISSKGGPSPRAWWRAPAST